MNELSSHQLLDRLIGFATVSRDSNLEMIAFIRDYLEEFGVQSELFYNPEHTKAFIASVLAAVPRFLERQHPGEFHCLEPDPSIFP
jgi:acetylornithine deacetylase